jgi:hypothetical protein
MTKEEATAIEAELFAFEAKKAHGAARKDRILRERSSSLGFPIRDGSAQRYPPLGGDLAITVAARQTSVR